jgi:hypothetical protein
MKGCCKDFGHPEKYTNKEPLMWPSFGLEVQVCHTGLVNTTSSAQMSFYYKKTQVA